MPVYAIDPTSDPRWDGLLDSHPASSIFHTRGWLKALKATYGYAPVAFTTSPPTAELTNAIVGCEVGGWRHKRRLVSLPFSDHCAPLAGEAELTQLLVHLEHAVDNGRYSYVEVRGAASAEVAPEAFLISGRFALHKLDLQPAVSELLQSCHADCIQRKIRRAIREGVTCEHGRSPGLLTQFYQLVLKTRRRHGLPAQPIEWFRNIIKYLDTQATVRIASKDGRPIAGIFTLQHKHALTYKYGCSDRKYSSLGGTQLLFWDAIRAARRDGLQEMDMGRSDFDNPGLIKFKDRWNASRETLTYCRYPMTRSTDTRGQGPIGKYVWSHAPESLIEAAGRILYRYLG